MGHDVAGFDRADGDDLLDLASVRRAVDGCAAVVHAGALAHDTAGSPEDIMAVNVLGTWHVLLAAEAAGISRVVYFSSGQVFGIAEGERLPDYFPVDDAHPRRAMRPYGLSKCLAEDLCAGFTARTGIPTVALRPAWVWDRACTSGSRRNGRPTQPRNGCQPGSTVSSSMSATSPTPSSGHWSGP
jgi:nucleoside-diphosphate-sugar epimerase